MERPNFTQIKFNNQKNIKEQQGDKTVKKGGNIPALIYQTLWGSCHGCVTNQQSSLGKLLNLMDLFPCLLNGEHNIYLSGGGEK